MAKQIKLSKIPLLPAVIAAIIIGIICGLFFPMWLTRIFITFNSLFGNFLGFIVPLLILGLVAPGIADLGKNAGRLLLITVVLAYAFTLFSGFFTYASCTAAYQIMFKEGMALNASSTATAALTPFFKIEIAPLMTVMTALVLAFTLGLGCAFSESKHLKNVLEDFKDIIYKTISAVIIPLLPLYIFGIFLEITQSGQIAPILGVFIKLIALIFIITAVVLFLMFALAAIVAKENPFALLKNMLPAYATALGTQSSAATIPVTLEQTLKNNVREDIADFVIPLCATINLSGSTIKITACAMAIMTVNSMPIEFLPFSGFIFMLGITMVAAPGVPGGAIMASIGILQSMLGFDEKAIGLMIALYIAMDSFGTATNVTSDGAIAVIINKIYKNEVKQP